MHQKILEGGWGGGGGGGGGGFWDKSPAMETHGVVSKPF